MDKLLIFERIFNFFPVVEFKKFNFHKLITYCCPRIIPLILNTTLFFLFFYFPDWQIYIRHSYEILQDITLCVNCNYRIAGFIGERFNLENY